MVEQWALNPLVGGSNPPAGAITLDYHDKLKRRLGKSGMLSALEAEGRRFKSYSADHRTRGHGDARDKILA